MKDNRPCWEFKGGGETDASKAMATAWLGGDGHCVVGSLVRTQGDVRHRRNMTLSALLDVHGASNPGDHGKIGPTVHAKPYIFTYVY